VQRVRTVKLVRGLTTVCILLCADHYSVADHSGRAMQGVTLRAVFCRDYVLGPAEDMDVCLL
jgi:hypothetical protein